MKCELFLPLDKTIFNKETVHYHIVQFTFERCYITVLFKFRFDADTKWDYQEWHYKKGMLFTVLIESFRFEDEDDKKDEIWF